MEQFYIMIDTECVDEAVLRGAGDSIHGAENIIIECNSDASLNEQKFRDGECIQSDNVLHMENKGSKLSKWRVRVPL